MQAMAQISEDVRRFEKALQDEANRIRTFSVVVEAEFTTEWIGGTPPDPHKWFRAGGAASVAETTLVLDDNRTITIPFGASDDLDIVPLPDGYVRMSYRADAKPGSQIFSESLDHIRELGRLSIVAYGLQREYSKSHHAHVRGIKMRFFANGVDRSPATRKTSPVAIIITIMVLELKVPRGADLAVLRPLLPVFSGYTLSRL